MIEIRAAHEQDWAVVRAVRLAALQDSPAAFGSSYERELAFDEATWRSRAAGSPDRRTFLSFDNGKCVALASAHVDAPADITGVWTAPGARGQGVAARVVGAALDWLHEQGCGQVRLHVAEGNEPALQLYRRLGFVDTGVRVPFERDPRSTEIEMAVDF